MADLTFSQMSSTNIECLRSCRCGLGNLFELFIKSDNRTNQIPVSLNSKYVTPHWRKNMLHNWCFCWSKNYSHWGKLSWIQMKFVSEMLQHSAGYSERHRFACCGHSFGLSSDRSSQRLRTTVFAYLKVALLAFWQWETEIAKAWNKWPGALAPLRPAVVTEDFSLLSFFKKHSFAPLRFWIRIETFWMGHDVNTD